MSTSCPITFVGNASTYIQGTGPADAHIAFVGEFVGAAEKRTREPFKGLAGDLFTKLMHTVGIPRTECYLTTLVKEVCYGMNVMEKFLVTKRGGVEETAAYREYRDLLKTELDLVHCNVIVAVGNAALYALTGKTQVHKWRGSVLESTLCPGRKVIPVVHPVNALHNHIWRHWLLFDLRRVKKQSAFPEIPPSPHSYVINPDFATAMGFLLKIQADKEPTGFDIEVMNEELSCLSFTQKDPAGEGLIGISIPFTKGYTPTYVIPQEAALMLKIEEVLEDATIPKVLQNATFDTTYMYMKYGIKTRNVEDTMIAQAVMYPDFPKGLDFITSVHTNEPYYKDEGKKHFKFGGKSEDFWLYNAKDSVVCHEAITSLHRDLERSGNMDTYRRQCRLIEPLVAITARGIYVDLEARTAKSAEFLENIERLTAELHEVVGYSMNPNSPKQLIDYFYGTKGQKPYISRTTGKPTVDGSALKRLSRKGFKEAKIIQDIRMYAKRRSTYLEMTLDSDNRLRGSYNPVGTGSLRLSSSQTIFDTGGNMQNLPYDIREYLCADEGYVCYQLDLGQAENRMVAYVAGETNMIDAFESGKDIHRRTAGLIFSKPEDDISDKDGSCNIGDGSHSERFWGKKANHGLNYDFGYKSFAFMYEIPERDAQFLVERYHTAYPGVRRYHQWVRDQLGRNRTLTNIFGWNRMFLDSWGDQLFKEAYSFIPQSSIGCLMNYYGVDAIYNDCPYRLVELQNQIHDAVWFQIPVSAGWDYHAKALLWIKNSLEQPLTWGARTFSIPVDAEIGCNYGHAGKNNPKGLHGFKYSQGTSVQELAERLAAIYTEYLQ